MIHPPGHKKVLIEGPILQERIRELALQIQTDFPPHGGRQEPILLIVLKGGLFFGADLLRALQRPMPVLFVSPRTGRDECALSPEDQAMIRGRDLIVADALMDSGGSLQRLLHWLEPFEPASVRLAVLLHKTVSHSVALKVHYLGFEVPDIHLVGYGLDEEQNYRGLSAIYA